MQAGVLGWLLIGAVAGVLGKIIVPGRDPGGFFVTILIGIAGALLGGLAAMAVGLHLPNWIAQYGAATGGSVVVLVLYRLVMRADRS